MMIHSSVRASRGYASLRLQRGQALTEFLVIAVALVPLFVLIPMIAKYQDIAHTTQMASRYAAFDGLTRNDSVSTWKPEAQLADEVRRRFFSNPDAAVKTNDTAGDFAANQNLFWLGPTGASLITNFGSDVTVSYGDARGAAHGNGFTSASDGTPFILREPLELQARGIYTANVSVKLANLPAGLRFYEPFDKIDLSITRSTSIALDPWTARDAAQVNSKVAASPKVFPTGPLKAISPVVDGVVELVDLPAPLHGPKLGQLDFWTDVVPRDRLKSGS